MSYDDIEIIEDKQIIEITDKQEVVELNSDVVGIEVTDKKDVIELKDEICDIIEVVNVNGSFVNGIYQVFIPTLGQTIFTLSSIPNGEQILHSKVFINGQKIALTSCYTISGTQLTVILPYSLNNGDILEIYY